MGRTFQVKLLTIIFLIAVIAGMQRFISAIQNFTFLEGILPFSPYYLIISGFLWAITGLLLIFQIWFNRPHRRPIVSVGTLFIAFSYWVERMTFYKNSTAQANLYFSIGFTLLIVMLIFTILYSPLSAQSFTSRRKYHHES